MKTETDAMSHPGATAPEAEPRDPLLRTAPQPEPTHEEPVSAETGGLVVERLSAWYGPTLAIRDISLTFPPRSVTAVIGPSGCGKSTLVRCLNRMHEVVPH